MFLPLNDIETKSDNALDYLTIDSENTFDCPTTPDIDFEGRFDPEEMRCLALVAHNHMKPAMKRFVVDNKNVLKKFRLTGTNTTMTMLREVFGDDPSVQYGPTCNSGPLGGDAELCALMCMEELGGIIFLQDPMDSHPHQADIACLNRLAHVHDIPLASNPASAYAMTAVFRLALKTGDREMMKSFFETKLSPSVSEYQRQQSTFLVEMSEQDQDNSTGPTIHEVSPDANQNNTEGIQCEDFYSEFTPDEMRCLALIAHSKMEPTMRRFIHINKNVLKKFRITGSAEIMSMVQEEFEDDPTVIYGPICESGPLGGDAQLCALMCMEDLGGIVFMQDPMGTHPHQADIDCLNRQGNVHDVYMANNTSSASMMMKVLKLSLESGNNARISSFFQTNVSPSVIEYKRRQETILDIVVRNEAPNDHSNESEHFRMVNDALGRSLCFRREGQPTFRNEVDEMKAKKSRLLIIRTQVKKLKKIRSIVESSRIF